MPIFERTKKDDSGHIFERTEKPIENQDSNAMDSHPFIKQLAIELQKHPFLKKAVDVGGEGAEFFNRGVTASGLPNAARGAFQGGSDLLRGLASLTPTGAGLPPVNIPDPKFSEMTIEEVPIGGLGYNPLQEIGGPAGYAATLLNPQRAAVKGASLIGSKIPTSTNLASKILQDKSAIKNTYEGLYKDLFKSAEEQGIKEIEKPKGKINSIIENTPATYHKTLQKFIDEPTLENAHWAQSDLGKLERSLEKAHENNPLTKPKLGALKQAKDYKEKLKRAMFSADKGKLEKEYNKISEGYKNDVLPYTTNKSITKFGKDELLAKNLISNLKKNDKFMIALGEKYPGIKVNQLANSPAGKKIIAGLLYGTGAGAGLEAVHKLF
jgi:hypothetical protein